MKELKKDLERAADGNIKTYTILASGLMIFSTIADSPISESALTLAFCFLAYAGTDALMVHDTKRRDRELAAAQKVEPPGP